MGAKKLFWWKSDAVRNIPNEHNNIQQEENVQKQTVFQKQEISGDLQIPADLQNPADFETAITATGFGKFNILLALATIPLTWASQMPKSATSYIPPFAACDLDLTLEDKGLLNAIIFAGMVSSTFIWGFISDAFGRKKIMLTGFLLNIFFVLLSGLSQNFSLLLFAKFMDGFTICGPYAISAVYLSEIHSSKHRARALMFFATVMTLVHVSIPALGLGILTAEIEVNLFNGAIILHPWNVFLLVTAIPSFLSVLIIIFLPESPKYLMTTGENAKALEIFKNMYSINSGKHPDAYSVRTLADGNLKGKEVEKSSMIPKRKTIDAIKEGMRQLKSLFLRPYGFLMMRICVIHFCMFAGSNLLYMWLPNILSTINDYTTAHGGQDADVCTMLKIDHPLENETTECVVNTDNTAVFYNAMYPGACIILTYFVITVVIAKIGRKIIYFVFGIISGIIAICIYFAQNTTTVIILNTAGWCLSSTASSIMIPIVVDLFPTTLRAMSVSLTMVSGRLGSMLGNIIFPYLLESGCLPPFLTIGLMIILATILMTTLPKMDLKPLE